MKRHYGVTILLLFSLSLLYAACGPIPTPNVATSIRAASETSIPQVLPVTAVPSETSTFTQLPSPTLTNTPPPQPLVEIFPQVDGGEKFVYMNNGGSLEDSYDSTPNCIHTGLYGLQLSYDMTGDGNGGWGVLWNKAPAKQFDASGFRSFTFWIKGNAGRETFQVGLKDTSGKEYKVESDKMLVVSTGWMQANVLLSEFKGVNPSSIENVNFGFNKNHGKGSICIDDLVFTP
jgi:hypothetical protein